MSIRDRLTSIEELAAKKSTVTFSSDGNYNRGTELFVENCRCVKAVDDNFIVLSVYGMDIRIAGEPLCLENFGVGSVKITGVIHSLTFEENAYET